MKQISFILFIILAVLRPDEMYSQNREESHFVLVYPELTKEVLHKNDTGFSPTDQWELFFMSNHFNYEMVNDYSLDDISSEINVVVIPSMEVVTEEIVVEIGKLLKSGKGVLITGEFAEYNEQGEKINSDYQKSILGFQIHSIPTSDEISINHTLYGNTQLTVDVDPGTKILLNNKQDLFYAYQKSNKCIPAGDYFPTHTNFPDTISGIILNYNSKGPLLWFGFNLDQLIGKNKKLMLENSFNWLSSKPRAFLNYWPEKYSSPEIIYKNIEKPEELNTNASTPEINPQNYFISANIFEKSEKSLKDLNNSGNINILWDDFYFSNLNPDKKREWLNNTRTIINEKTGQKYFGISLSGEVYDSSTYDYLTKNGYSFAFTSGYSESFSYKYDSTKSIYSFVKYYDEGRDFYSKLNFMARNSGIIYINDDSLYHSEKFNRFVNNPELWNTTFSDLLEWISEKKQLILNMDDNQNYYDLTITNNGQNEVKNIGVWISVPEISKNLFLENPEMTEKLTFDYEMKMFFLSVSSVPANNKVKIKISSAE